MAEPKYSGTQEQLERFQDLLGRPAKVKCQYCWKPIKGVPLVKVIYTNGQQKEMVFCSEECAAYRQFSAEG